MVELFVIGSPVRLDASTTSRGLHIVTLSCRQTHVGRGWGITWNEKVLSGLESRSNWIAVRTGYPVALRRLHGLAH